MGSWNKKEVGSGNAEVGIEKKSEVGMRKWEKLNLEVGMRKWEKLNLEGGMRKWEGEA